MSDPVSRRTCGSCARVLEFAGAPPRFCAYCGRPLGPDATAPAVPSLSEMVTTPPAPEPEAATLGPAPEAGTPGGGEPEAVGGYKLVRRLGGGGMGSVYEAEDPVSGRCVALKLVLPEYAASAEAVQRFRQEGRLASSLSHPRCVFVLAADEDAGRPYIVMELMPGQTLDDLVRERGPLPVEEAVAKILDVIDGLREAHRRGLVHRDVKPSNCFLEAGGRVKVGDFGLARSLVSESKLTRTGTFLGTPLYAAPVMNLSILVAVGFGGLLDFARLGHGGIPPDLDGGKAIYGFTLVFTAIWVVWAFLFRGGYAFWRGGIVLWRADGRKASRLQCAFRALLVWAPVGGLFCLAAAVARQMPWMPEMYFGLWGLAVTLLIAYVPLALWSPTRGPHDRLAGTYLVPN